MDALAAQIVLKLLLDCTGEQESVLYSQVFDRWRSRRCVVLKSSIDLRSL